MLERLTVFYQNVPFPPNQGGKADMWRRILALRHAGVSVQLIHWAPNGKDSISEAIAESLDAVIKSRVCLDPSGRFQFFGLKDCLSLPLKISQFRVNEDCKNKILNNVREFDSQAIWVEGPWTYELAEYVARKLQLPLLYRSHNIEYQYLRKQAALTSRWHHRMMKRLAIYNLAKFELSAMKKSSMVFDISADDMLHWSKLGVDNTWLPPIAESALIDADNDVVRDIDVLFLGNLMTPNNLKGVNWLLDSVWPHVQAGNQSARLVVAGSGPSDELVRKMAKMNNVVLMGDVPNAFDVYRRARVHVNPVMVGSGVQLKTVEMLVAGGELVTTTQGLSGLPSWVKDRVRPVDKPLDFAERIVQALLAIDTNSADEEIKQLFSISAVEPIVDGYPKYRIKGVC